MKEIAAEYQSQNILNFRPRQPIRAIDWKGLVSMIHGLFASQGERVGSVVFDPEHVSTKLAYDERPDDVSRRWLSASSLPISLQRMSQGRVALVLVQVYGNQDDLEFTITNEDTQVEELDTLLVGDDEWTGVLFALPQTFTEAQGKRMPLELSARLRVRSDDIDREATLLQMDVFAVYLDESELPTSPEDWVFEFVMRSFSTAGETGRLGPSQATLDAEYTGTPLEGEVTQFGTGVQVWEAPVTGTYRIAAAGASGGVGTGASQGGRGAVLEADFVINAGQSIYILCGQEGASDGVMASGGGGTSVELQGPYELLLVAGGGGGHRVGSDGSQQAVCDASLTESGNDAFGGTSAGNGGTLGGGGDGAASRGAGGGGYFTPGQGLSGGGDAFEDGAAGGSGAILDGGYGAGGAIVQTTGWGAAGGGGGYSGGGGSYGASGGSAAGGGGGSFIASGASNVSTAVDNVGAGWVTIDLLT